MYTDEQRTHDQDKADERRPLGWELTGKASKDRDGNTWIEERWEAETQNHGPYNRHGEMRWVLLEGRTLVPR